MFLSRVFNKLVTVACAGGPSTVTLEGDRSRGSSVQGYLGICGETLFPKTKHEQLARYLALLLTFSFLPSYIRKYNAVLSYKEKYIKQRENALVLSLLPLFSLQGAMYSSWSWI